MKLIAHSWRTHKSNHLSKFMGNGGTPFAQHPYIEPEDWDEFVQLKTSKKCIEDSVRYKALRGKYKESHSLGTTGYDGKFAKLEQEDLDLSSQGIQNPWSGIPEWWPRNWLQARGKLQIGSDASVQIVWGKYTTKMISEEIKEKVVQAESFGLTWVREKDLLSACLGPKQLGRVWGFSSTMGWKHAWPECSSMYKKKRRSNAVDVEAITAQNRTHDLIPHCKSQLRWHKMSWPCFKQQDYCIFLLIKYGPEPYTQNWKVEQLCICIRDGQAEPDSTHLLTDPTTCALLMILGGHHIEGAMGRFFPHQTMLHTVPLLKDHVVVQAEFVHSNFVDYALPVPFNDEVTTIGQALLHRMQWVRTMVLVNPLPMYSISSPSRNSTSNKDGADNKSCSTNLEAKVGASNDATGATRRSMKDDVPNKASSEKHQPSKGSKNRPSATSEKKKKTGGGSAWTKDNPKFLYGKPMLISAELQVAGLGSFAMNDYIVFGHNTGGHWILVVIIPKWHKVLYLDSNRNRGRDLGLLEGVLDERQAKKLAHDTKFSEFEVLASPIDKISKVINVKGEFHCANTV
ncbi:hypothetical protein BS78_09G114000 [Paspalum vaginatum]|nr:hypothetical protein BS78_09G114000 [Paspalum vaginatum]